MATALLSRHADGLSGLSSRRSGALPARAVHPASPVLLTSTGPLGAPIRARSQFEPRSRPPGPRHAAPPLYPAPLRRARRPAGHFGGNQLPGCSIGLSPLHPGPRIDLHVRTPTSLPRGFPRVRPAQAQFTAFRVAPATLRPSPGPPLRRLAAPRLPLAPRVLSLVRVSRRAHARSRARGFRAAGFTPFHPAPAALFFLPSRYFSSIGLPPVFSLRWRAPPFALRARAALLAPLRSRYGTLTLSGARPPALRARDPLQRAATHRLPPGLFPLRSPLLRESAFVSSPPFTDMLKSKGSSCACARARTCRRPARRIRVPLALCPPRRVSRSAAPFLAVGAQRSPGAALLRSLAPLSRAAPPCRPLLRPSDPCSAARRTPRDAPH